MTEIDSVVGNFKEGFLLKMKKGLTGSKYWKKHWVYADSDIFFQWQSSAKPLNGESPKYSCTLKDCKVEESQIRKFAFKITANGSSESMVYAADDFDSYESWLKILFGEVAYSDLEKSEANSELESVLTEDFKQITSDKIADFFYEHDISMESHYPVITEKDLRKLLLQLDPTLNTANTVGVILHDLQINQNLHVTANNGLPIKVVGSGATVAYEEFKQWWSIHSHLLSSNDSVKPRVETEELLDVFRHVSEVDRVLFAGLQQTVSCPSTKGDILFRARVPKHSTYNHFVAPVRDIDDQPIDWNERYQSARESASMSQSYHLQAGDETGLTELWTNYRVAAPVDEGGSPVRRGRAGSAESGEEGERLVEGPLNSLEEALQACLALATLLGDFHKAAIDGSKLIINEYSLPAFMKTTKKVTSSSTERLPANRSDEAQGEDDDLYEHDGLLFRIVASPAIYADRDPDSARTRHLTTSDDLAYRRITAEQRSSKACLANIESLYTDYQTSENWKKQTSSVGGSGSPKRVSKFKHFLRPCALLSTLVDHAGFCVQVFCPAHIVEQFTLVHGFAQVPRLLPVRDNVDGQESDIEADRTEEDLGSTQVFVNSLPAYRSLLSQLAGALNVKLTRRQVNVTTASLFESDDSFSSAHAELLSSELQAHRSTDDRLYMLNFGGVFPSDLPREMSFDATTRQLRPEFVRAYLPQSVPCGPVFSLLDPYNNNSPDENDNETDDPDRQSAQQTTLSVCEHLYTIVLPRVARVLDSLNDLLPCDSHELTHYLHNRGINMRHLGLLHSLCRTPCVRQLLLTECVARACKSLLRHSLRRVARQSRAESLAAEHRGRSKTGDFIELMDQALIRRRQVVLDLFNLIFAFPLSASDSSSQQQIGAGGRGSVSEEFWRGALLQIISQKFGVDLNQLLMGSADSSKRLSTLLHLPQLFLAIQYHTNCRFKDSAFPQVFSGGGAVLFVVDDILDSGVSSCDGQQTQSLQHIPGELGRIAVAAETFLANGLYAEATQAFQLRLVLLATINHTRYDNGHVVHSVLSLRQEAIFADVIYKLALSQYCNKQYSDAAATIRHHHLARHSQYSAITGRMLTLLMSIEQHCGRTDRVRAYFDAAQCVYSYALSVHHPMIVMHMCALADLYQRDNGLKQARAMLVLAKSMSGKALGEHHQVGAALSCKLAVLLMNEGQFKDAAQLLSNALIIFDATTAAVANDSHDDAQQSTASCLDEQIVNCLCALTECLARCDELDLAIHSGFRCVELCTKMLLQPQKTLALKKCNALRLSCLLVLSDLFVQKSELDSAFGLLHEAWTALRSTTSSASARRGSGSALAALTCRILELMISTLPMQIKSHFQNVSEETLLLVDSDSPLWDKATGVVCSAMWNQKPVDYLASVIHGIQRQEDEKRGNKKDDHVSFSLQAAVISRIIKNPQEFSQQLVSF